MPSWMIRITKWFPKRVWNEGNPEESNEENFMLIYFLRIIVWFSLLFEFWSVGTKVPKKSVFIIQLILEADLELCFLHN